MMMLLITQDINRRCLNYILC